MAYPQVETPVEPLPMDPDAIPPVEPVVWSVESLPLDLRAPVGSLAPPVELLPSPVEPLEPLALPLEPLAPPLEPLAPPLEPQLPIERQSVEDPWLERRSLPERQPQRRDHCSPTTEPHRPVGSLLFRVAPCCSPPSLFEVITAHLTGLEPVVSSAQG